MSSRFFSKTVEKSNINYFRKKNVCITGTVKCNAPLVDICGIIMRIIDLLCRNHTRLFIYIWVTGLCLGSLPCTVKQEELIDLCFLIY